MNRRRRITSCPAVLAMVFAALPAGYGAASTASDTFRMTDDAAEEMEPQWSPDGRYLSYGSGSDGDQNVFIINLETRKKTRITSGLEFVHSTSWSPDGKTIAYVTTDNSEGELRSHIYAVSLDNGAFKQITHERSIDGSPSWSPDGTELAFASRRSGPFNLWIHSLKTNQARMITDDAATDHAPECLA